MLKHPADLSDDFEYFIGWTGQSTSRPFGLQSDAYGFWPDFEPQANGIDLTSIVVQAGEETGTGNVLSVSTTLVANAWVGAQLRLGTQTTPIQGHGIVTSNTTNSVTVDWTLDTTVATHANGYLVFEDMRFARFSEVRVLTPFQPTTEDTALRYLPYASTTGTTGRKPISPGFVQPAGTTSFENHALLLDYTWNEGIDSYGISDLSTGLTLGAHTATTFVTGKTLVQDVFGGGYIVVDWDNGGTPARSWQRIKSNDTAGVLTLSGNWEGSGTPTGTVNEWTAWIPHYNNSPHAYEAHVGFLYPNNDMHPHSDNTTFTNGAAIRNRPRGVTAKNYSDLFGDMLVAARRISQAIGKRVNVVMLGINGSVLAPTQYANPRGFPGLVGWYSQDTGLSWAPGRPDGIWSRWETLVNTCVQNALEAEGNTKPPRFLCHFHLQGEGDAIQKSARLNFDKSLQFFKQGTRNLYESRSAYTNGAEVPFIQPRIMEIPYARKGTFNYYGVPVTFVGDDQDLVNNAIVKAAAGDEFSDWIPTDDLPRNLATIDVGHCDGVGECIRGTRLAYVANRLIDYALGFGSPCLTNATDDIVELCNRALSRIGNRPRITSLTDGSKEALRCNDYIGEARDVLLQARQWGFATKRVILTEVQMPRQELYTQFGYAYVLPSEALNAYKVFPINQEPTVFDKDSVTDLGYSASVVSTFDETLGQRPSLLPGHQDPGNLPLVRDVDVQGVDYYVERDENGGRLIYTDEKNATLQFTQRVSDVSEWSPQFQQAFVTFLAGMLAGGLIGGQKGTELSIVLRREAMNEMNTASASDAMQRQEVDFDTPGGWTPGGIEARY